jgi:hypothetical protein
MGWRGSVADRIKYGDEIERAIQVALDFLTDGSATFGGGGDQQVIEGWPDAERPGFAESFALMARRATCGHLPTQTRLRRGFAFLAAGEAWRAALATMAPAAFLP